MNKHLLPQKQQIQAAWIAFRHSIRNLSRRIARLYDRVGGNLSHEERYRFHAYITGMLLGIPICFGVAIYHFVGNKYAIGTKVLLFALLLLIIVWIVLTTTRYRPIMYRIAVYSVIIVLIHTVAEGSGQDATILWMYVIPPNCFFLLPTGEALGGILFSYVGIALIFFNVPLFLFAPHAYPGNIQFRFWLTYSTLCVSFYIYKTVRDTFQKRFIQEHKKLQDEIQERARIERQLTLSVQEKEVLLKEIHHRVKNNLQVVFSLLHLQVPLLRDEHDRILFQESQQRVKTMALIHEKLYQSESLRAIDFQAYVRSLTSELYASYQPLSGAVEMVVDVADIHLDLDTAIPCGLILTELLSNALKYGISSKHGKIMVTFSVISDQRYELRISDNGAGIPPDIDLDTLDSLGLQLVKGLVEEQLDGMLELERHQGTAWRITFPGTC